MHKPQRQVREWHEAVGFGVFPAPGTGIIDINRNANLRQDLILEEVAELQEALIAGDVTETIDALCDLLYVIYGAADTWGIDIEPYFDEVHRSNMTKVGGPIRDDGKRLKPETYEPPVLVTPGGKSL